MLSGTPSMLIVVSSKKLPSGKVMDTICKGKQRKQKVSLITRKRESSYGTAFRGRNSNCGGSITGNGNIKGDRFDENGRLQAKTQFQVDKEEKEKNLQLGIVPCKFHQSIVANQLECHCTSIHPRLLHSFHRSTFRIVSRKKKMKKKKVELQ
jgi:hypothetical protein